MGPTNLASYNAEPAPEIPNRVRRTVERALNELRSIQQSLENGREADRMFGPEGRYEADAYQNTRERREQWERIIEEFRTRARAMGIDPEAVLAEMGGMPDLSISDSAQEWL